MYRDNTLIPTEAVRLCALGALMMGPRRYGELAREVRHFTDGIVGRSLELLGTSLELLRFEGLVEAANHDAADDDTRFEITDAGRRAFDELMRSGVRAPGNDMGKLVIALKMRFLHLVDEAARLEQIELLIETCENERVRLAELRACHKGDAGALVGWLDHDIAQLEARLSWFWDLRPKHPVRVIDSGKSARGRRRRPGGFQTRPYDRLVS